MNDMQQAHCKSHDRGIANHMTEINFKTSKLLFHLHLLHLHPPSACSKQSAPHLPLLHPAHLHLFHATPISCSSTLLVQKKTSIASNNPQQEQSFAGEDNFVKGQARRDSGLPSPTVSCIPLLIVGRWHQLA
ncbi:hypothetical protein O6H91_Y041200 [Diphasiastrum complanatum]|nr:hypothetical protein O6H91_Y041200 [Diphasiastrum complanatum]